jgi:hypothetical protein
MFSVDYYFTLNQSDCIIYQIIGNALKKCNILLEQSRKFLRGLKGNSDNLRLVLRIMRRDLSGVLRTFDKLIIPVFGTAFRNQAEPPSPIKNNWKWSHRVPSEQGCMKTWINA